MNEIKYVGKRYKSAIHVPIGIDVKQAIKIYNQGYGHCLRNVVRMLREKGTPVDTEYLASHIVSLRKTDKIHLVQSSTPKAKTDEN